MLKGVGKWVTLGVTTAAAIVGLLVNARNLGLTPWLTLQGVSFADLAARRVTVFPPSSALESVGDTLLLSATVADQHGATLSGATLIWRTDDSAVVVVDSSGTAVARGPGVANVSAAVREHVGRARITVNQRLEGVAVAGDSALQLREGEEGRVAALGVDPRGHPIRSVSTEWTSTNPGVATVDAGGRVVAVAPGHARLLAAAGGKTAVATVDVLLAPATVAVVGGTHQRAPAGRGLPQPVTVQVLSKGGRPVPGIGLRFALADGFGSLQPATDTTDRAGRARTRWSLGATPGRQRLLVNADGLDTTVAIEAEADPVRANTRVELMSEVPTGRVKETLGEDILVRVTDSLGMLLADVPVTWTPLDGGAAKALADRTDSLGQVAARWTLGPRPGTQRLNVYVGNPRTMQAYSITVHAMSGWPAAIKLASGGTQRATVGQPLPQSVAVQVLDQNGNPIPEVTVSAQAIAGAVEDSVRLTDARGEARFRWTLGRAAGRQELVLSVPELKQPLRVAARGMPRGAANVVIDAPPTSPPGRPVLVKVSVTDVYGNPVPDVQAIFSVSAGTVTPVRVMTDDQGRAAARWTVGVKAGDQTLTVSAAGTRIKSTHTMGVATTRRR